MTYYVAEIYGQIFANPPYYILRGLIVSETNQETLVIKGKIPGPTSRGTIITFEGKRIDPKTIEVTKSPINPNLLKGDAYNFYQQKTPAVTKSIEVLSHIAEAGVPQKLISAIWDSVQRDPDFFAENPWSLVHKGLPFKVADKIALALNPSFDSRCDSRIEASVYESTANAFNDGNCYTDSTTLFRDVYLLTNENNPTKIATIIKDMIKESKVIVEKTNDNNNAIYLPFNNRMENEFVELLSHKQRRICSRVEKAVILANAKYPLTNNQIEAIQIGLSEPISIISGLPGTGKTTILATLCKILKQQGEQVLLVAPTGIAAKRLSSVVQIQEAQTIHRAFGAGVPSESDKSVFSNYEGVTRIEEFDEMALNQASDPSREHWTYHPNNPRPETVIIIDESSMVDLHLAWRIVRSLTLQCRIIFVGDIAQLPPIGAGFTFKDMIECGKIPSTHLTQIFRQDKGNGVVEAAHAIFNNKVPNFNDDFVFIESNNNINIISTIMDTCIDLQNQGIDYQVISPSHHGDCGVTNLNKNLRARLNPTTSLQSFKIGNDEIRVGDKVMITQNDYKLEVFNGDLGYVRAINKDDISIMLKTNNSITDIPKAKVSSLIRLAYAITVHKSQGQEYPVVIMPLVRDFGLSLLQKNLVYTAITRAKVKCILVGDKTCLDLSIHNTTKSKNKLSRIKDKLISLL
jgi:exodeoxyribonuclease V alpha subunit